MEIIEGHNTYIINGTSSMTKVAGIEVRTEGNTVYIPGYMLEILRHVLAEQY